MTAPAPAPAWYEDPYDHALVRWWNGEAWTTAVRQHPSPISTMPPPPGPPLSPPAVPAAAPPPPPAPAAAPPPPAPPPPPPEPPRTTTAASFGAALLPPLTAPPPPAPPGTDDGHGPAAAPSAGARPNKLRLVLVAGLVVALLALAFAAYSSGMIGASSREASTAGATVVEGPDFSLEVPDGWTETDAVAGAPENLSVVAVRGPGGLELAAARSDDQTQIPDDPEIRRRLVDLMIATQVSVITNAEVLSRVPSTLGGAEAEFLTVQGVSTTGQAEQAYEVVALHDGRIYLVILGGSPDAVAEAKDDFDAIVASFRFDD